MPDTPEDDRAQAPAEPTPPSRKSAVALERPIQEHLGRELRTTYHALAEKPAFLGDPALPPHVERHVQRLESREKAHERGVKAVESVLQEIELFGLEDDRSKQDERTDRNDL